MTRYCRTCGQEISYKQLTPAEIRVVQLVAEGLTDKAIAVRLGLEVSTIKTHVAAARRRLDVDTRTGLAMLAQATGIIDVDSVKLTAEGDGE